MSPTYLPSCSAATCSAIACSAIALLCTVGGCASLPGGGPLALSAIELTATPFHPQTAYQCGPSALATVLHRTRVEVTADELSEQVYVPGRRGSLQLEMMAATRRYDRLAVQIDGTLPALVEELQAGRPVLVLQNLGVGWLPLWHYAVVVGYDPAAERFVLRSGTTERLIMRRSRFAQSWARADNWAMVVLDPAELPRGRDPAAFVRAVAGLESTGRLDAALEAYRAGLTRWSSNHLLLLGYGNALYGSGSVEGAVEAYRDLLALNPNHLPARNNLAHALGELGCRDEALAVIAQAPAPADDAFVETFAETRRAVAAQPAGACRLD